LDDSTIDRIKVENAQHWLTLRAVFTARQAAGCAFDMSQLHPLFDHDRLILLADLGSQTHFLTIWITSGFNDCKNSTICKMSMWNSTSGASQNIFGLEPLKALIRPWMRLKYYISEIFQSST